MMVFEVTFMVEWRDIEAVLENPLNHAPLSTHIKKYVEKGLREKFSTARSMASRYLPPAQLAAKIVDEDPAPPVKRGSD